MNDDTLDLEHISVSKYLVMILRQPLRAPWSIGATWSLVAFGALAVWAGLTIWWVIPAAFILLVGIGGIMRAKMEDDEWETEQVLRLQKTLVWMIDNRNQLAELAGVRYMGAFLDPNDVTLWQLSTAPQVVDHDDVYEIRQKAAFAIACAATDADGSTSDDGPNGVVHVMGQDGPTCGAEYENVVARNGESIAVCPHCLDIADADATQSGLMGPMPKPKDTDTVSTRAPVHEGEG